MGTIGSPFRLEEAEEASDIHDRRRFWALSVDPCGIAGYKLR